MIYEFKVVSKHIADIIECDKTKFIIIIIIIVNIINIKFLTSQLQLGNIHLS